MKNSILITILVLILIPSFLVTCSKEPDEILPEEPVLIDLTSDQIALIESGNSFAFDIFRKVVESSEEPENIMISPLSISYALSMTLNGANGATRDSMLKALKVSGITPEEINNSYQKLTEALLSVDKRVIMTIANSVWTENSFPVKQSFIDILETYYDAEARSFSSSDPQAKDIINQWIEDNTNGLIKNMLDELDSNIVMLLINAIYFKGMWKFQFNVDDTEQKPFYKTNDETIDVPMMNQEADLMIYRGNNFTMAELPYGQGNFVMDIILPDDYDGINSILPLVTESSFNNWISQATETDVDLFLPRFKYGYKESLKKILGDMGMGIAFSDGADFSNIANFPLYIDDVIHQSLIETNEEGTEAAAATVVTIGVTSAMPSGPLVFNADHPFIYIIRETTTNSVIFMGVVIDPTVE
jgi:serine protease inhibitor